MSGRAIFWTCGAIYELAIIFRFYILPAIRRRKEKKISRMSAAERRQYLKYINY